MKSKVLPVLFFALSAIWFVAQSAASPAQVDVSEGTIEVPAYEFSGRELQPPLFQHSSVEGTYPYPQFLRPYTSDSPKTRSYRAIFVENEYIRLTVVPALGGRVYSLFDKVNGREVFYKNDVLKWSGANPRRAWLVGNIEITGPYDHHTLTIDGEPFWFDRVVRHPDGSASVVLGSIDPFFRMKVDYVARIVPGLAAMELSIFCYNPRDQRRPYMFWVNAGVPVNKDTRFIYPMTRTIGHTTSEVAGWPYYNGVDFSWFKNNNHMLGVFGIDIYDNFLGAYDYAKNFGTFRWADRRVTQGMKTWTWGSGERGGHITNSYTDKSGPYIEIQSGRNVWDGHYEWIEPQTWEGWSEWWFPVAGIGGMTTTNVDVSLNLDVTPDPKGKKSSVRVGLYSRRARPGAKIMVTAGRRRVILDEVADLAPGKPFDRTVKKIAADSAGLAGMKVLVLSSEGDTMLAYDRPDVDPGRKEYTIFTERLERPIMSAQEMTMEELVLDAETKLKEMHTAGAIDQLRRALEMDPGYTRAHLNLGLVHHEQGRPDSALVHLEDVLYRDPYNDQASYYTALSLFELGDTARGERYLYYIARPDKYYSQREYLLGRLAWSRGELESAATHLVESSLAGGYNLNARNLLGMVLHALGRDADARLELERVLQIDPTNRWAIAEISRLPGGEPSVSLRSLLGGQAQEAIELALVYRSLGLERRAIEILELALDGSGEVWGTPPIYYYTLGSCYQALGDYVKAGEFFARGKTVAGNLDRFPFRRESLKPLAEAVVHDPADPVARFLFGCLLYYLERPDDAIQQWRQGAEMHPEDFNLQRNLGMALYENGGPVEEAFDHLERALEIDPSHIRTFTDLSFLYSREGYFDRQLVLLHRALERAPGDDRIIQGLIATNLVKGDLDAADSLFTGHRFEQRHRDYSLRDMYRWLEYGKVARDFAAKNYKSALEHLNHAQFPPSNLGVDDFQYQSAPRLHYYRGLVLQAAGKTAEAREAFESSTTGWEQLSGDRDSWNSENFYMALSLEKLGKQDDADRIFESMEGFARGQLDSNQRDHRSEARYLLGLSAKHRGDFAEANKWLEDAVQTMPDNLGPRFEQRRDVPDPLP